MRTVESEPRCNFWEGFGDPRSLSATGAGLAGRTMRGLLPLEGPTVEILVGHANLIVQVRFGGAIGCSVVDFGLDAGGDLGVSFRPQAKVMQRLRPRLASTVFSLKPEVGRCCRGPMFSSSCRIMETGWSKGVLLKIGAMLRNVVDGSGGLGVLVRVPGLVKPPSLVSSAVDAVLLLLHVEADDNPLDSVVDTGLDSSTGDPGPEEVKALVRSDSLR